MREKGEDLSLLTVACPRWVGDMHSDNSCSILGRRDEQNGTQGSQSASPNDIYGTSCACATTKSA